MDFCMITASASELSESAIGYRITSESQNPDQKYGVHLNPTKSEKVTFSSDDLIIVLSED
jgi:diphthamide synthase (EF-2-diphthine--ammonia ligase)